MNKKNLQGRYKKGKRSEWLGALFLMLKGYAILKQRYQCPFGEIDLIAKKGKILIAIEVKTRTTYAAASESVTKRQQMRIKRAISYYMARNIRYQLLTVRFDAILFVPWRWPYHLKGAWFD